MKKYFGINGITMTEANHLANIAKEYIQTELSKLDGISFIDVNIQVLGTENAPIELSKGVSPEVLNKIDFEKISEMNSFCAWVRSAIKEKEKEENKINSFMFNHYLLEKNIKLPEIIRNPKTTFEEEFLKLDVDEMMEYYYLEAKCASIGKQIHPDCNISNCLKELRKAVMKPRYIVEKSSQNLLYIDTPSGDIKEYESIFFNLQEEHRNAESKLNRIKSKVLENVTAENKRRALEDAKSVSEFKIAEKLELSNYEIYIQDKLAELASLKIIIPDRLKPTLDFLRSFNKQ